MKKTIPVLLAAILALSLTACAGNEENADPARSYYPYGGYNAYYYAGLDCSGYVGWALYNTLETEDGREGYVRSATDMALTFAKKGYGRFTREIQVPADGRKCEMKPGDLMSTDEHVWISLGTCGDGSMMILHSTPAKSRTGQPGGRCGNQRRRAVRGLRGIPPGGSLYVRGVSGMV